jgi:glycosyltransferase involved in cell wall biosynthesis
MNTQKPKIAILTIRNTYNYGGVLSSVKVAYEFASKYFDPTVFFLGFGADVAMQPRSFNFSSSTKPILYFGMNCIEVGARWAFWEPGHYWFTRKAWAEALAGYDYIFVVSGTGIAAHPAQILGKKYVLWIATSYQADRAEREKKLRGMRSLINSCARNIMDAIELKILQQASFILAYSKYAEDDFRAKLGSDADAKIVDCGFPIDTTHYPAATQDAKENALIAVGRFSDPRKNIGMLIRVFAELYRQDKTLKLYITGMKPEAEIIFPFIDSPAFANIIFTGQVSSHDLHHFYQRCKLMLITSYQEGLGIVGLEAMHYGLPVVATDCGGTADYVINGYTGYLVPINDDAAMVKHAHEILTNEYLIQELAFNAKQLIATKFSQATIYNRFKEGLSKTYPELAVYFQSCDERVINECSNHRPYIHSANQS